MARAIGVFGGTFDPIHYGHLRPALDVAEALDLAEVRFIPSGHPPHRGRPVAPSALRLEMVKAAIADEPRFVLDEREIHSDAPSYSVTTLESLRRELPATPLALIVGMDAFLGLTGWHRWRELLDLAHLVVAHRPGWHLQAEGELSTLVASRQTHDPRSLQASPAGHIYLQAVTQLEISSTAIRALVAGSREVRYLMPDEVRKLIIESRCYGREAQEVQ
ncbi:MAG TPA: nicotinate-nucleotide adenylyltransferase [Gammaproteobacteria bacterium]|jgi:nicotinate-nucleotide adenylyltransferase|nr:nicotinate-nucleotide adenylyltransferase [Gammaproteobacteria bacterium]